MQPDGTRLIDDPDVRDPLADMMLDVDTERLWGMRNYWHYNEKQPHRYAGPQYFFFQRMVRLRNAERLQKMLGYDALVPEERYDELGADWNSPGRQGPPPGWQQGGGMDFGGGGGSFSDFFEAFFRGSGGKKRKGGFGSFAQRGNDVELELPVHIEEALQGGRKAFNLDRSGRTETVTVNIPRGVRAGQKIRLAGGGADGIGGGERGDLYLIVKLAPHVDYRADGFDLIRAVPVPVWAAVLGGDVEVPTPDGTVKMKIPAGTQPGQKFRLKGRGLPSGKDTRGDFFAEAKVLLPTSLGEKERALWEQLAGRG